MVYHGPYAQFKTGLEAAQASKKSGISAIVVGAGIGGLVCATELVLNGHGPVTVYESVREFKRLGDTIGKPRPPCPLFRAPAGPAQPVRQRFADLPSLPPHRLPPLHRYHAQRGHDYRPVARLV